MSKTAILLIPLLFATACGDVTAEPFTPTGMQPPADTNAPVDTANGSGAPVSTANGSGAPVNTANGSGAPVSTANGSNVDQQAPTPISQMPPTTGTTGTTGTGAQVDACASSAPVTANLTVNVDEVVPELGVTVNDLLINFAERRFDEVKYVPYTGEPNWTPEQVASLSCGSAAMKVAAVKGSVATVILRDGATAACPSEIAFRADLTFTNASGEVRESIQAEVFAYVESAKATSASRLSWRASQPISEMKGSARPVNNTATDFVVEESSSEATRVALGFTIPPLQKDAIPDTKPEVISAGGTESYAVWTNTCAALCPAVAAPPADFCQSPQVPTEIVGLDGCKTFVCK